MLNACTIDGNYLVLPNGRRLLNNETSQNWLAILDRLWKEQPSEFTAELLESIGFQADFTNTDHENEIIKE